MQNELTRYLDHETRIAVVIADCTAAAGELARAHLSGPTASCYLARSLAGVALLGSEASTPDEAVTFKLDCPGPLGGFLVEATGAGTLRGYTKIKILDDFDGMGAPKDPAVLGPTGTFEVVRSVPGKILASGAVAVDNCSVASGLETYFTQSLQRKVAVALAGIAGDDGVPSIAKGIMAECPPDGDEAAFENVAAEITLLGRKAETALAVSDRNLLSKIGLAHAEPRGTSPLSFACRCSRERASAMLAAIPMEERKSLPPTIDVTCHMCGRTWTVPTA